MSDPDNSIVITAIGALTPVGADAGSSTAAIAAGVVNITEHAYFECTPEDPEWDEDLPLFAASVPTLPPFEDGMERLLQLALPPLTEVMGKAKLKRADLERCGFMLALPEAGKAINALQLNNQFIPELCRRTGLTTFCLWKVNQVGHTGVFSLLPSAIQKLQAGDIDLCVLGGVESYLLEDRLVEYDSAWRLRSERTVDGFIPGEASVMLLLETAAHARARGMPILARLGGLGDSQEAETISSKKHSTGEGLSQAIQAALQTQTESQQFQAVYCSLNGESYYAFEWGVVLARLHAHLEGMQQLTHPADCIGDIGAASGAMLMACATFDITNSEANTPPCLLWTASDDGHRMALTLHRSQG